MECPMSSKPDLEEEIRRIKQEVDNLEEESRLLWGEHADRMEASRRRYAEAEERLTKLLGWKRYGR